MFAIAFGLSLDYEVFLLTARGGIIQDSAYSAVWAEARKKALTEAQQRSPPGRGLSAFGGAERNWRGCSLWRRRGGAPERPVGHCAAGGVY